MTTSPQPTPEAIEAVTRALVPGFGYMDAIQQRVHLGVARDILTTAALPAIRAQVLAEVVEADTIHAVAKASWDRGERDYWDSERDHRPFDPSITELDSDQVDRGREWVDIVTEVLTDLVRALANPTPAAKEAGL